MSRFPSQSIAVLVDRVGPYQRPILQGLQHTFHQRGLHCTIYVGRELNHPHRMHHHASQLYDLVDPDLHPGTVLVTSTLGNFSSDLELQGFVSRFTDRPTVTVGRKVAGVPVVQVDGRPGMQALIEHLLQLGRKDFVFVRGIAHSPDSHERERVCRDTLARHGLKLPESRVLTGNFYGPTTKNVLLDFLREHPGPFDCVVCANDDMALAVMAVLQEQGRSVPDGVAVVGFDDAGEGRFALPALTTVRQPLFEQGVAAATLLLRQLEGEPVQDVWLETELVVRQSCGSPVPAPSALPVVQEEPDLQTLLVDAALNSQDSLFLDRWQRFLRQKVQHQGQLDPRHSLPARWSAWACTAFPNPLELGRVQHLCVQASGVLLETVKSLETQVRLNQLAGAANLNQMGVSLGAHDQLEDLQADLLWNFNALEVQDFHVVTYTTPGSCPGSEVQVFLSRAPSAPGVFGSRGLLPDPLKPQLALQDWWVHPLFINEEHYGYWLMVEPPHWERDPEVLRYIISRGMHNVAKSQTQRAHAENLERQVQERTRELARANQELQRSILLDGLTRVYNRAAFNDALERMWREHCRSGETLSLILCDVDFFKRYNDSLGHLAGDECLRQVAQTLQQAAFRPGDFVARYGGEEFAVLLPGTSPASALLVAERIQQWLLQRKLPHPDSGVSEWVTLSMGIQSLQPTLDRPASTLIQGADQALYQSKRERRNQITLAP